ncbi:hypothetical protein ACSQ76_22090 [Roseovarius sp. B08]|uniref:hypothetical protein n=1 Tax=Roseovarius sp. B08 TaxID=3449223 RepID=UPI003EDC9B35
MRFSRAISVCGAFLIAVTFGVKPAPAQDCSFESRLIEPTETQLTDAVKIVNGLLGDPELRLELAKDGEVQGSEIPVFAVKPSDANGMVAHVRQGCRAILIGTQEFEESFPKLAEGNVLIKGHEKEMLALLLLHELGHIHLDHYGGFIPSDQAPALNLNPTASKEREEDADAFAAGILRDEITAMDEGEAFIPGVMAITFVSNLSVVISAQASLDCFGCRVLGSPDVFWDHSQSHENLEYRLLKMNHAIAPTDTSQQLLDDYERARDESGRGNMRIVTPDGGTRLIEPGSEEFEVFEKLIGDLEELQQSDDED